MAISAAAAAQAMATLAATATIKQEKQQRLTSFVDERTLTAL